MSIPVALRALKVYATGSMDFTDIIGAAEDAVKVLDKVINKPRKQIELEDLPTVLDAISKALPNYSRWDGKLAPVLWFDEANKLKQLNETPEGGKVLTSLLDWMVASTKQDQQFHVVLSTSDAFYLDALSSPEYSAHLVIICLFYIE